MACHGSEIWTVGAKITSTLGVFKRKILLIIMGPVRKNNLWRRRNNHERLETYKEEDICNGWGTIEYQKLCIKLIREEKVEHGIPKRDDRTRF